MLRKIAASLRSARTGILIIALTYVCSVTAGAVMAHRDNGYALSSRDAIVARAHRVDPSARADDTGAHGRAAAIDFSRNLFLAAVPETIGGMTLVLPVGLAAYRGWVGGIVSVDGRHRSRLRTPREAVYYLVTLLVQLTAFTLAGGAGIHLGWSLLHHRGPFIGPAWFRVPKPAVVDAARIYLLVVPLFAAGSLWEFVSFLR